MNVLKVPAVLHGGNRKLTLALASVLLLTLIGGCSGIPRPGLLPETFIGVPQSDKAETTLTALTTAVHMPRDRYTDAIQIKDLPLDLLQPAQYAPPKVGDQNEFYVNYDFDKDFRLVPATLRLLSENGAWWVADNATVSDEELKAAADNFENIALKVDRLIYGPEPVPGIDNFAPIHFLFVDIPEWGEYYGYFSIVNQYPKAIKSFSNEKEMMVLNTGSGKSLSSAQFASELAHEFGHLIHWSVDPNEDLWMNEAFSELAAFLTESPPVGSVMNAGNQQVYANYPFIQLNARPETSLPEDDRNIVFAHYGAEKLFMVYLLDRFGPKFMKDLIANPNSGLQALDQELGKLDPPLTLNQVYPDWILANLLNQPGHPQGRFGYSEVQTLLPAIIPLNTFTGEKLPGFMPPYSVFYYELQAKDKVTVDFKGATMARLTPADPYEGEFAWYSNRGDETSFTLTRSFDLTGVNSATLNFRVWYELEEDFDYGYVLASGDGGKSWDVLPTRHGMVEGLSEDSYGIGYTGESKAWLKESLDLSQYAGKTVLIRFVVNTDLATNRDGMQIDNIEIPEINFFDGAENDQGGWDAQGFVRSANIVPVEWVVWIVKVNTDPNLPDEVTRVGLGDLAGASFEVDGFGETFDFAAMVISPMAVTTTMSIDYEFSLTGQ